MKPGQGEVAESAKKRRQGVAASTLPVLPQGGTPGGLDSPASRQVLRGKAPAAREEHLRARSCEPDFGLPILPPTPPCDADPPPELREPPATQGKLAMQVALSMTRTQCAISAEEVEWMESTDELAPGNPKLGKPLHSSRPRKTFSGCGG